MPSAFDNRPLIFDEFTRLTSQTIYVSATPGPYELKLAGDALGEQVIRPTGLMDPRITVRPAKDQVDDLLGEIRARAERDERVLVTTLTKRMAEDLTEYYQQLGLRVRYLHSDIDTLDRVAIIRDLLQTVYERDYYTVPVEEPTVETFESPAALQARIVELETRMKEAAKRLDFEQAAELRDRLKALRKQQIK